MVVTPMVALLVSTSKISWSASTVSPLGRQQAQHSGFRNGIPELGHQNGYFRHEGNWVESNG